MDSVTSKTAIERFLGLSRIAVVGVSRNPRDFTRKLFADLRATGYDCIPVNPATDEVDGMKCYKSIREIEPRVDGAMMLVSKGVLGDAVMECASAGVKHVWIYGITGSKSVAPGILDACRTNGVQVVAGYCPYMFLQGAPFFHKVHGTIQRIMGMYPCSG
jgi:predicted CoA-binding protein